MSAPRPETLLEMVARLDKEFQEGVAAGEMYPEDASWPRLRDSIGALQDFARAVSNSSHPPAEEARVLLARLDNPTPKEPGE